MFSAALARPWRETSRDGWFVGLDRPRARLYAAAELNGVDLHSLRHGFASVGAHVQNGRYVAHVGPLLGDGYTRGRTITDRYIHGDPEALRPAADAIADRIAALLGMGEGGSAVSIEDGRTLHA